jgi:hypothetical protein
MPANVTGSNRSTPCTSTASNDLCAARNRPPPHLVHALGDIPTDESSRSRWIEAPTVIETYRLEHKVHGELTALGQLLFDPIERWHGNKPPGTCRPSPQRWPHQNWTRLIRAAGTKPRFVIRHQNAGEGHLR